MTRIAGMIDTSDGALFAIPAELSDGVKKPIVHDGRECLEVGPQYPDSFWRGEPGRWGQEDTALKEFLDRFKERSVIYIR